MVQKSMNGRTSIWQEILENIYVLIFCKDKLSGECKCYKNLNLSKQVLEFIDRSIFFPVLIYLYLFKARSINCHLRASDMTFVVSVFDFYCFCIWWVESV